MKLTLGDAARYAKRSKGTLSKALNYGKISAIKDDKGRWQIDPSELSRWMDVNPFPNSSENHVETHMRQHESGALEVEVRMLREHIANLVSERERERRQFTDQIEDLRGRLDGAETERIRINAILTDQRGRAETQPKRSLWARLIG